MRIIPARYAGFNINDEISRVFVEGFYPLLKHLCRNKTKLANALAHMFKTELFYVALDGPRVAGFIACTNGQEVCVKIRRAPLRRHLGFWRGNLAYTFMKRLNVPHYPFPFEDGMGALENLAVDPDYRGQGIARRLFAYAMNAVPYCSFTLEVADNNTARQLYEKLGFREVARVSQRFAAITGTKAHVYMQKKAKMTAMAA